MADIWMLGSWFLLNARHCVPHRLLTASPEMPGSGLMNATVIRSNVFDRCTLGIRGGGTGVVVAANVISGTQGPADPAPMSMAWNSNTVTLTLPLIITIWLRLAGNEGVFRHPLGVRGRSVAQ
jgi:hypothetical protein